VGMGGDMVTNSKSTKPKPFIFVLMPFDEKFEEDFWLVKANKKFALVEVKGGLC